MDRQTATCIVAAVLLAACGGNPAEKRSAAWIPDFAERTESVLHCGNGWGVGIDNRQAWYEWTLLADGSPDDRATQLARELESRGYDVTTSPGTPEEYLSTTTDQGLRERGWATEWTRLDASNDQGQTVLARVANAMTLNSCHGPEYVINEADPADADVVTVIKFEDPEQR